jgi:hypothetical protein
MDLKSLLSRNRKSLLTPLPSLTPREKRAHEQFAREYAEQVPRTRAGLGAWPALRTPGE